MRRIGAGVAAAALAVLAVVGSVVAQERYGATPEGLEPFSGVEPYHRFFVEPPTFRGPGREEPDADPGDQVSIGVLLPAEGVDHARGVRMGNGVTLAVEEANAAGGFAPGVPFEAIVRDEAQAWGAAANAAVDLRYRHDVWAIVGGLEDEASHVLTRVLLKIEVPSVNTAGPDPTLTEHAIPWLVRMRPDDRQNGYRLAKRMFEEDGRERVVVFRSNDRYGRTGTRELVDAARRLRHPILLEVRFADADTDWAERIERLRRAEPDAIVVWGRPALAGRALRALRDAGLEQPVYGPDRLVDAEFLEAAGPAAEGTVFTYPFDLGRTDPAWKGFRDRYRARFRTEADATAAYAYDGTRYLIDAIRSAGLNRPRIRDALFERSAYTGVSGTIRFDSTHNNVAPVITGRVRNGAFTFD